MNKHNIIRFFQLLLGFFYIACSSKMENPVDINCTPSLLSPQSGEVMDNGCYNMNNGISWFFEWSECPDATKYRLYVKSSSAISAVIDKEISNTFYSFSSVSNTPILTGWAWKVKAYVGGEWREWTEERTFNLEPVDTDCSK
jgi:hypothetical protein